MRRLGLDARVPFRDLWGLFYPIVLMTFMGYLTNFLEKVMFGYLSAELIQASVDTYFITWIFQTCGIKFASLAQVYTGRWYGSQEFQKIGQGIWQFVWFSVLSMAVTIPLGFWLGKLYFQQTTLAPFAIPYLNFCLTINFLYPLKMTLTGFYLGIGKVGWVTRWTIGSHALQLILDLVFIFGVGYWVPSLGLMGGALSTLICQGGLCLLLVSHFINAENRSRFGTCFQFFSPKLLWILIQPGLFRVGGQLLQGTGWVALSFIMTQCGNFYASVLAVGTSLFYFLACFGDAVHLCMINLNTRLLGSKAFHLMRSTLSNGMALIFLFSIPLMIPLIFFPETIFYFFFPKVLFTHFEIQMVATGIWILCMTYSITCMASGFILAFKDVKFLLLISSWSWIFDYGVCTIFGMKILNLSPLSFWFLISSGHLLVFTLYYLRIQWLQKHVADLYLSIE